jgi:hypothetical protein
VTVAKADDPAVVTVAVAGELDFEDAEVAGAIVAEGVSLATEVEASAGELVFDLGEEVPVGHGIPGLSVRRGWDFIEGLPGDLLGSAVEEKAGWEFGDDFCFNEVVHRFIFVGWVKGFPG